jgi:parvulin-like peptidyl-prolyl isomerase
VKSPFGYHLIQVEKITPATPQTFEAAKDTAKQQAASERQEKVMEDYMKAAKAETGYVEGSAAPKASKGAK